MATRPVLVTPIRLRIAAWLTSGTASRFRWVIETRLFSFCEGVVGSPKGEPDDLAMDRCYTARRARRCAAAYTGSMQ